MSESEGLAKECIEDLRKAIGHRATWMYLLLDEAEEKGLDPDGFAREAIMRCGKIHGEEKFEKTDDLEDFASQFLSGSGKQIFEMEVKKNDGRQFVVDFHYCPLVAAWESLTESEEEISQLCDIAMDGDRGIISEFPDFELEIEKKIADGDDVCRLNITKSNT
mgnify:CR=1 FL=1